MYKHGNDKAAQKGHGKAENSHRSKVFTLDSERLVKTIEVVNQVNGIECHVKPPLSVFLASSHYAYTHTLSVLHIKKHKLTKV